MCYSSQSGSKRLLTDRPCILRMGVEKHRSQSFLCMLASVYKFYNNPNLKDEIRLTADAENLNEFKNLLLQNLSIDKFIAAQNGNLPQLFEPQNNIAIKRRDYESFFLQQISSKKIKRKIISSYENFINFIKSDTSSIDYTYIWDLICKPLSEGGILFKEGINLLIFKAPNSDMTSKIEMICPTHHGSSDFFTLDKPTLMVYSENNFFEPLCKLTKKYTNRSSFYIRKFS